MKRKKLLALLLAATSATVSAFAFTGCNEENGKPDGDGEHTHAFDRQVAESKYLKSAANCTEKAVYYLSCSCGEKGTATFKHGQPAGHKYENGVCGVCNQPDPDAPPKKNQLTAEEWANAFDFKKFGNVEMNMIGMEDDGGDLTVCKLADGIIYTSNERIDTEGNIVEDYPYTSTDYYTKEDGKYYHYRVTDDGQSKTEMEESEYGYAYNGTFGVCDLSAYFADFTYDEATDGYVCRTPEKIELFPYYIGTITLKFEDDKIKSFYADLTDEYHALKVEMTFKYGTAEITLPDIDLPQINTDGFSFTANKNGGYSVSGMGEVNVTDLVIPATYNGEPVTEIAASAFKSLNITSLELPDSVTAIGSMAFYSCKELKTVKFGSGLKTVNSNAFQFCENLYELNATVEQMCGITFKNQYSNPLYYAQNLVDGANVSRIEIPESVTKIGDYAFVGCNAQTLIIGDGVTTLGAQAFADCTELTEVKLGNGITQIGSLAFKNCDNIQYTEYENAHYLGNGKNAHLILVKAAHPEVEKCAINENTKFIMENAFMNCIKLLEITVPAGVTHIGATAFYGCEALKTVNYNAENVATTYSASLSNSPFGNCPAIDTVNVGKNVTFIPKLMFRKSGVVNIVFEGNNVALRAKAFGNCDNLKSISFLNGTTAQWNAMIKANDWDENTGDYTITCSDGTINKAQ